VTTPVFWHVTRVAGRAEAEAARDANGTALEAYGGVWQMTIGDAQWRARGGARLAAIGPVPVTAGIPYAMRKAQHHSGVGPSSPWSTAVPRASRGG
jgi:hypothetical protein